MDILFRWGKMHYMQKALFVLLSMVLVACGEKEKVNLPDEPETPAATITLAEGTDTNPLLDTSGGTVTLHFTATADWKATVIYVLLAGLPYLRHRVKQERHRLQFRSLLIMAPTSVVLPFSWSVAILGKQLSFHRSRRMH